MRDRVCAIAAALQAFGVNAIRLSLMARGNNLGRNIFEYTGTDRRDAMRAYHAKLMHRGKAPENGVIAHMHMPRERSVIGKNSVVANLAVMRDMTVGHNPIIVAYLSHADVLRGAAIQCAKFADDIPLANFQTGGLARIFFILRNFPYRGELKNFVLPTNARMPGNHGMRAYPAARFNLDMFAD